MNININEFSYIMNGQSSKEFISLLRTKKSDYWTNVGKQTTLKLFKRARYDVPAYKRFLQKNNVRSEKIKTWSDFQNVPIVSKKNYLRKHPLEALCWKGSFKNTSAIFTATSGSTGKPFYFPRSEQIDWQSYVMHELFLRNDPTSLKKSTLVIVCFGMGVWIGGLITYTAFKKAALSHYSISIITPGVNKKEIFEALGTLRNKFDQVILCGYPPFIKDIIDEGKERGISWRGIDLKIVFAAEIFSERFRDYIAKKTHIRSIYTDTVNIYGTADLGTMAEETPLSILIRRMASKNKNIFQSIFKDVYRLPTLVQFIPLFTNFEEQEGKILCTGDNTLPLIRYDIGDYGGVLTYKEMVRRLLLCGVNLKKEVKKRGIAHTMTELPFVYVYERTDFSTKLYGAIIYPEQIKNVFFQPMYQTYFTGKFTFSTKHDVHENQRLEINIELKKRKKIIPRSVKKNLLQSIISNLTKKNAEYKNNFYAATEQNTPQLIFWENGYPAFFQPGIKQKWVKK